MKSLCLCILALLLFPARARSLSSGADFLTAQIPARPAALSGAFAANGDDPNAFLWNPSALASIPEPSVSATHFSSIVDTTFDQAAFAQPLKLWDVAGGMGLSVQHSSTSNLVETDLAGNNLGAIDNGDWVLDGGYGFQLNPSLQLGLALKVFDSRLAQYQSEGYALDFGGLSQISPRVALGVAFANLGSAQAFDQVSDPLPGLLRLAAKALVVDSKEVRIDASAELDRPWASNDPVLFNLGGEYWYESLVAFRAGYRFGVDQGNLSLGIGVKWGGLEFDYAYVSMGDLGLSQRFSLSTQLGQLFEKVKLLGEDPDAK
jgi:hypothetical protein